MIKKFTFVYLETKLVKLFIKELSMHNNQNNEGLKKKHINNN